MDSESKKLTPIKFLADKQEMPWGTIEYKIADLGFVDSMASEGWLGGNNLSDIMQTYLERISGETAFEWYGTQFPVLIKRLVVKGKTSLHINPDDETARVRYDAFGKTALWYVEEAGKNAALYLGFKKDVGAEQLFSACKDGSVESLLHKVTPKAGDYYLITPGMVHAAKDVTLVEIAEASELWFRLHDWGSTERELHLEEAFDLIDMGAYSNPLPHKDGTQIVSLPQFTANEIPLTAPLKSHRDTDDTFLLYLCLKGEAVINEDGANYRIGKGELILIPADVTDFGLLPAANDTVLLEIRLDPREDDDLVSAPVDDGSEN